ncbi:hypothetical protein PI125_g10384 [Phytophthora idaei]|nr:hypothetical protein PI125_g10384 [Phytophthora idaei]
MEGGLHGGTARGSYPARPDAETQAAVAASSPILPLTLKRKVSVRKEGRGEDCRCSGPAPMLPPEPVIDIVTWTGAM